MKVFGLHFLKNSVFFILKLLLIILFAVQSVSLFSSHFEDIKTGYQHYTEVRAKENWYTQGVAELVPNSEDTDIITYSYSVGEEVFYIKIDNNSVESIDKFINIVYDINIPENNLTSYEIKSVEDFYANSLRSVCMLYIEVFLLVLLLGFSWFLLDYLKNNKVLWKVYV